MHPMTIPRAIQTFRCVRVDICVGGLTNNGRLALQPILFWIWAEVAGYIVVRHFGSLKSSRNGFEQTRRVRLWLKARPYACHPFLSSAIFGCDGRARRSARAVAWALGELFGLQFGGGVLPVVE